jgi:hypothetical protein
MKSVYDVKIDYDPFKETEKKVSDDKKFKWRKGIGKISL